MCNRQQQRDLLALGQQVLQQQQRGAVGPVNIVDKNNQRTARRRKGFNQAACHQVKAISGVKRVRMRMNSRFLIEQYAQLRHQVNRQPGIVAQQAGDVRLPARHLFGGKTQHMQRQRSEGGGKNSVG